MTMEVTIPTPPNFSFMETIRSHGWRRLLPFTWLEDAQTLERIHEFPDRPPVLLSICAGEESVIATASGDVPPPDVTEAVSRMLQLRLPH